MPREASPEVAERRENVRKYFFENPDTTNAQAAEALGIKGPTLAQDKKHLGLTAKQPKMLPHPKHQRSPAPQDAADTLTSSDDATQHIREAIQAAGGVEELFAIVSHLEAAGGVTVVRQSMEQYRRLHEIFG